MTPAPLNTIALVQGDHAVSCDAGTVFSTVLGSCVAVCLHDPAAGAGGMNHFLLPGETAAVQRRESDRFGVYLMEVLIDDLIKIGGHRDRMQAKLFGGGHILRGLGAIGAANAAFARDYLRREGIKVVAEDLGGERARRVQFWPASGRARQIYVAPESKLAAEAATIGPLGLPFANLALFA
ncbi:chemotaxis protein CheD [Rhodoblastus acidophilus]|uniref:chemotaxis protein CheD n=1 Tax=Rhodoblastus acidophilus TaxID=1074 RepID=UPI0022248069|nr:chemotaxis protein CheD [Rhodoblastus acidophilus]MCW2283277.1 chemotaxis protein CheD [Rhodoblastus acidophilus]MCW2332137.1 chemotaxis protein CheD [Rhodoblastus acidophilus]